MSGEHVGGCNDLCAGDDHYLLPDWRTLAAFKVCEQHHGGEDNSATIYGHHGSVRICVHIFGSDQWVYDPRWENAR